MKKRTYHRYDGVQALRFFAAFLVLITHSTLYATERLGIGGEVWGTGAKGVDIFFVISGFVMVISSHHLIGTPNGWSTFLLKRCTRVVPLYWMATTLKLVILLLAASVVLHAKFDWWYILKSYFFIPSENIDGKIKPFLGVGWTLVFEMFFYLIFTLALFFKKNIFLFVGLILLAFSSATILRPTNYSPLWYLMDAIILEFYFGMLIGYLMLKNKRLPTMPSCIAIFLAISYMLLSNNSLHLPRFLENGIPATILVWSIVSLERHLQDRIPSTIMFFGAASYALYLFHPMIAPAAPEILKRLSIQNSIISVIFSITLAMIAAAIIHRFAEIPAAKFFRKLNK
ncbi:Exopolysaccharide production protein ExoZ [hydrothermal vent metagenome]|uniref:Exopolysaccharide production protein ExoZ n=1 Tax=hydrothermal vent metagenome TaxID=652676 RepID=A0A3B0WCN0_9ZZZZ